MEFNLESLVRENIKRMTAYSSARHEFSGMAAVFLDANENSFGSPLPENYNRYPDPLQMAVKEKITKIKGVPVKNIFLGNGSDEAIDLLFRIFCEPGRDNAIILPPTYGMYEVCAEMNNVKVKKVSLTENFQLDLDSIEKAIDSFTKLIFICSPNNPTGNSIGRNDIEVLLNNFEGLVVIDEAYINYAKQKTFITELTEYPNLVVLQTLSKAWVLAGLRLGMAFAAEPIINYMSKVKYPYNISTAAQNLALEAIENIATVNDWIKITVGQREWLKEKLSELPFIKNVYPSDANFVLAKMDEAGKSYDFFLSKGILGPERAKRNFCSFCVTLTLGRPQAKNSSLQAIQKS